MAVPVVESYSTQNTAGSASTSISIAEPSGTADNDLLVIIACSENTNTDDWNALSGWTKIIGSNSNSADADLAIYWRISSGTDAFPYSLTAGSSDYRTAWCLRISGVDTTTPINVTGTPQNAVGSSIAINEVTTTVNDCLAIYALCSDGSDLQPFSVSGTGWTESDEDGDPAADSGGVGGCWGTKSVASAGGTGAATVTASASDGLTAVQIAIAPPSTTQVDVGQDSLTQTDQVPAWTGPNGASFLADLNTDVEIDISGGNVQKRVVYEIQNDGSDLTPTFKYMYAKNGGAYSDITTSSSNIRVYNSANLTDGDDSPQVIGSGTLTVDNNGVVDATDGTFALGESFVSGNVINTELSFELVATDLVATDYIDIDVFLSDGTTLATRTQQARITITGTSTTVTVPADSQTIADQVPAIYTGVRVDVPADSQTITDQTPIAASGARVDVPADSQTITDYIPTVALGIPADSLTQTDYAPEVFTGASADVPTDTLTQTDYAPGLSVQIAVPNDTLTQTDYAPQLSSDVLVQIPQDSLTIEDQVLTIESGVRVDVPTDSLVVTDQAPSASATDIVLRAHDSRPTSRIGLGTSI